MTATQNTIQSKEVSPVPDRPMTSGEKLLKRLAQYPGKVIRATIVLGFNGEPMIVIIEEEHRAELLSSALMR